MEIEQSFKIFRALADSSRLMLINLLLVSPGYVEELAQQLKLSVSTVSFHLTKLESAGLVYKVREQYYTNLHLNRDVFKLTLEELISFNNIHKDTQDERMKSYREKVLNTFFNNGRLIQMPVQYKKQLIVLEALLSLFEPGRIYNEREVDSIIEKVYDDYCSIRRYFIDENMMFRKKGRYQVNEKIIPDNRLVQKLFSRETETDTTGQFTKMKKEKTGMKTRDEIKKEYKETSRQMGAYILKDMVNDTSYIGSSKNIDGIINRHRFELKTGIHSLKSVQEVWNKFGEEGVKLEVLDKLEPKEGPAYDYTEDLKLLQEMWENKLNKNDGKLFSLYGTMIRNSFHK